MLGLGDLIVAALVVIALIAAGVAVGIMLTRRRL